MGFKTHVFISYAHSDNLEAGGPGWVTQFHEILEPLLTSRLKRTKASIWRDKRLSDNDEFDPVIMKQLPDAAVFVAVLSDNYVYSDWCRREAQAFCELASQGLGLAPADKQRVFKILKLPPEQQDSLPDAMRRTLGTPFFVREDKDGRETNDELDLPVELDPGYSDEYGKRFRKQIAHLAQDIANTLKAIDVASAASEAGQVAPPAAPASTKPTVYLAQCAEDRLADREALRSELVQRGHTVLPHGELPTGEAGLLQTVTGLLERSALAVHLLGRMPGRLPPDSAGLDSDLVIQNTLAVARARSAPLLRLVSLPEGTHCARPNHEQFLQAMLRDADVHDSAEVITGSLQDVKNEMLALLQRLEKPPPAALAPEVPPGEARPPRRLYLLLTQDDLDAAGDLFDALETRFRVSIPVFEGTPEANRQANEQCLTDCDAVLVYYGSGTDDWFASMLSEVAKAAAWRAGRPFDAVLQCIAGPVTPTKKFKLRRPQPHVINALEGFTAGASFDAVFQALAGAGHG